MKRSREAAFPRSPCPPAPSIMLCGRNLPTKRAPSHIFARGRKIPHLTRQWQGEKPETGLQAAAREARYRLLVRRCREDGCAVHRDRSHGLNHRKAQTVRMRQNRSQADAPGLAGMADGMLVDRRAWVLRPFLRQRRADIRNYLTLRGEDWLDDPSNANPRFERVQFGRRSKRTPDWPSINSPRRPKRAAVPAHVPPVCLSGTPSFSKGLPRGSNHCSPRRSPIRTAAVQFCRSPRSWAAGGICRAAKRRRGLPRSWPRGGEGRMTAGRVVFDRRRSGLYLYREARNLPDLVIQPHQKAIWDGRFIVTNIGAEPLMVGGGLDARSWRRDRLPQVSPKRSSNARPSPLRCSLWQARSPRRLSAWSKAVSAFTTPFCRVST